MDELVQHCLRELSFDGDFGESPLDAVDHPDATRDNMTASCAVFESRSEHLFARC
jgi:hypothetical protein